MDFSLWAIHLFLIEVFIILTVSEHIAKDIRGWNIVYTYCDKGFRNIFDWRANADVCAEIRKVPLFISRITPRIGILYVVIFVVASKIIPENILNYVGVTLILSLGLLMLLQISFDWIFKYEKKSAEFYINFAKPFFKWILVLVIIIFWGIDSYYDELQIAFIQNNFEALPSKDSIYLKILIYIFAFFITFIAIIFISIWFLSAVIVASFLSVFYISSKIAKFLNSIINNELLVSIAILLQIYAAFAYIIIK